MSLNYEPPTMYQGLADYAVATNKSERTIKRYLEADKIPGAVKDERGRWKIPIGAVPQESSQLSMPRAEVPGVTELASRRGAELSVVGPGMPDLDSQSAALPTMLSLDQAIAILNHGHDPANPPFTRRRLLGQREEFGLIEVSKHDRLWMMPLVTIKRLRGLIPG